jgi:large subunit ribosomal protein L9
MKLILTNQVQGLGAPGDIVEVKDGYGRNYLVPRGMALVWSKGGEKQIDSLKSARDARTIRDLGEAKEVKGQLEALEISLAVRAGDAGRLFGAVTANDVVEAVSAAGGPALDKRSVMLSNPIKTTGDHVVTVQLHPEVDAAVELKVVELS